MKPIETVDVRLAYWQFI